MSYERLAYDDADTAGQMHDDCTACGTQMSLPRQRSNDTIDESAVTMPAPSLAADGHAAEIRKPQIEVSEAAAYLASRLHLHLD
jgi:hypothetical protein